MLFIHVIVDVLVFGLFITTLKAPVGIAGWTGHVIATTDLGGGRIATGTRLALGWILGVDTHFTDEISDIGSLTSAFTRNGLLDSVAFTTPGIVVIGLELQASSVNNHADALVELANGLELRILLAEGTEQMARHHQVTRRHLNIPASEAITTDLVSTITTG